MANTTTIQVPREVSEMLERLGTTKGEAVERLLKERMVQNTRVLSFSRSVEPGTQIRYKTDCPINGVIKSVGIQFPPGCNFLVGARIDLENVSILPSRGFVIRDGFEDIFEVEQTVKRNDNIFITIRNQDDTYPHQISIEMVIVGEEE